MRRFRPRGGFYDQPITTTSKLTKLATQNTNGTFYTARENNISAIYLKLLQFIKDYLSIPDASTVDAYTKAPPAEKLTTDFDSFGRAKLAVAYGITKDAPSGFNVYLPAFTAYDFLIIAANKNDNPITSAELLRTAGMIRTILPTVNSEDFGKWETYYRDFKMGKYSGGLAKWRARKAAETPYDPVDPVFNFVEQPRVKIPRVSESSYATGNAMYLLDAPMLTGPELRDSKINIVRGGFSRRSARSSRRRY